MNHNKIENTLVSLENYITFIHQQNMKQENIVNQCVVEKETLQKELIWNKSLFKQYQEDINNLSQMLILMKRNYMSKFEENEENLDKIENTNKTIEDQNQLIFKLKHNSMNLANENQSLQQKLNFMSGQCQKCIKAESYFTLQSSLYSKLKKDLYQLETKYFNLQEQNSDMVKIIKLLQFELDTSNKQSKQIKYKQQPQLQQSISQNQKIA